MYNTLEDLQVLGARASSPATSIEGSMPKNA